MRVNINSLPNGYKVVNGKVIKTMALGGVPRSQANLEAEKGETALTDLDNDGVHELHTIGGNRHSSGGTPLQLPPQSFIFSDTAKMKFSPAELAELGIESTKKQTPAWASKKHPLNKFIHDMDDEHSDNITNETSELMLQKNKLQLSKIAFMQEAKKDFLDEEGNVHVPLAAYPFLISKGVNPEEFIAKLEEINNQKTEAQGMPPQGMQQPQQGSPQGGPMHQMPDGTMMPGAYHGAPPQGPPMMNEGGEIQQLLQEIAQALQQGAQPEQIMQQLVQMGIPEQQAMQVLQYVIQSIQGQQGPPTYQGDKGSNEVSTEKGSRWNELQSIMGNNSSEGVGYNDQWDKHMSNDEARELYDWQMSLATGDSIPPGGVKNYFVQGMGPLGPTTGLNNIPKISTTNRNYEDKKDSNLNWRDYLLDFIPGVDKGTRSHYDVWNPNAAPEKRNGGPIMKSGGGLPCLTCGGPVMGYGGSPFEKHPLSEFVYGGQELLRQYQGSAGSSEIPDTFRDKPKSFENTLQGDDWASVRELWYKTYSDATDKFNNTAAGIARPLDKLSKEEAFASFYKFNDMNVAAEAGNYNYNDDCKINPETGNRPVGCSHNNKIGDQSYDRMKKAGLIENMTADQYAGNTRQFQAMYQALGSLKHGPDVTKEQRALLDGLNIETSPESAHNMTQYGYNVSSIDGKNGVLTSSSHVGIADPQNQTEETEEKVTKERCPDEAAKSAECAARNAGGSTTTEIPATSSLVDNSGGRTGDLTEPEVITNDNNQGPVVNSGEFEQFFRDGDEIPAAGGTWTWSSETCQCVQGSGTPKPGEQPEIIPWVQDQNNLNSAMWGKYSEEDQWPMKQKLPYNDADYIRHDPLTAIHANNSLAASLGDNAPYEYLRRFMEEAGKENQKAVQNVQDADADAYNRYAQTNATGRARVDEANSAFASKYVDDTNSVLANRIAKDQLHDANINMQNNALLTNMANTYNQNSLYPNYNVRPDYAGAIQFANPQALRDEQSQTGNPKISLFQEWKDAYPDLDNDQIIRLVEEAEKTNTGGSRNQPPGGYQGPTEGIGKYGTEMRDLEANRKALRRWILGIQ